MEVAVVSAHRGKMLGLDKLAGTNRVVRVVDSCIFS